MHCPTCKREMKKIRWEITNNFRTGIDFKEYDKYTYQCVDDDIFINIETPLKAEKDEK